MSDETQAAEAAPVEPLTIPGDAEYAEATDAKLDAAIDAWDKFGDDDAPAQAGPAHPKSGKKKGDDTGDEPWADPDPDELEDAEKAVEDEVGEIEEEASAEDGDDSDEPAEPEEDEDDDARWHRAYTWLHDHLGIPAKMLRKHPHAELIQWGEAAKAKAESAVHTTGESKAASNGATTDTNGEPERASTSDLSALRTGLADELGVDAEKLKPLFDELQSLRTELTTTRAESRARDAAAQAREGQAVIDMQMRRLNGKYPELKGDSQRTERVVAKAHALAKSGDYSDPAKLFNDAAKLVLGGPKRADLAALRRNGGGTPPPMAGGRKITDEVGTEDDYFTKALDYVDRGRPDLIGRLKYPARK